MEKSSSETPTAPEPEKPTEPPAPPDFVEEGGLTPKVLPWVLVGLGVLTVLLAVFGVWLPDEPARGSLQVEQVASKTTAPAQGAAGTTSVESRKTVLSVSDVPVEDDKIGVLDELLESGSPDQNSGSSSGSPEAPGGPGAIQAAPETRATTTATTTTTTTQAETKEPAASSAPAVSTSESSRSETVTVTLLFLGALLMMAGAFYSRVTSFEFGPGGIKFGTKALHYVRQGVLRAAEDARAAGKDVRPADVVVSLAAAERQLAGAAVVAAEGRPAEVAAARRVPFRDQPGLQVKGRSVVLSPAALEDLGRRAFDSTITGNPDFQ